MDLLLQNISCTPDSISGHPKPRAQASLLLQPGGGTTGLAAPPAGAAATPFVLLAHVKVHAHLLPEHAAYAAEIDGVVEHSEPGMLYHSMDQDPANPCRYTWTEIYRDDAALLAHFDNPAVRFAPKFWPGLAGPSRLVAIFRQIVGAEW
jgi:quinol monooxygenase YgiN